MNDDYTVMQLFSGPDTPLISPRLSFSGRLTLATRNEDNEQGLYAIVRGTVGIQGEGVSPMVPYSLTLPVNAVVYQQLQARISAQHENSLAVKTDGSFTLEDIARS